MDVAPTPLKARSPTSRLRIPHIPDFECPAVSHSRSPTRSPTHNHEFSPRKRDSLLRNLSPVSTLEALRATDAVSRHTGAHSKILADSIAEASTSERALGIRAALAGKKLREWCEEVQNWHWPKTFEGGAAKYGGPLASALVVPPVEQAGKREILGSLSEETVRMLDERIEAIRDEFEELDVEELKDHVRGAHLLPDLETSHVDVGADRKAPVQPRLGDFTVIVTATIMQALPYISKLNRLLEVWYVRLAVFRQVPGFSRRLANAEMALESAWDTTMNQMSPPAPLSSDLSRSTFDTMRDILQERVSELARGIDFMLDALEGGQDTIPDQWIDKMEAVEEEFKDWAVVAERKVQESEWRARLKISEESEQRTYQEDVVPTPREPMNDIDPTKEGETMPRMSSPQDKSLTKPISFSAGERPSKESAGAHMDPNCKGMIENMLSMSTVATRGAPSLPEPPSKEELAIDRPPQSKIAETQKANSALEQNGSVEHTRLILPEEDISENNWSPANLSTQPTQPLGGTELQDTITSVVKEREGKNLKDQDLSSHSKTAESPEASEQDLFMIKTTPGLPSQAEQIAETTQKHIDNALPVPFAVIQRPELTIAAGTGAEAERDSRRSVSPATEKTKEVPSLEQPASTCLQAQIGDDFVADIPRESTTNDHQPPLTKPMHIDLSNAAAVLTEEGRSHLGPSSATSSTFSDISNAQIMDAAPVQYFSPIEEDKSPLRNRGIPKPHVMSRQSSQQTETSRRTLTHQPSPLEVGPLDTRSRSSSRSSLSSEPEANASTTAATVDKHIEKTRLAYSQLRSASTTSIEVLPRSELRNINITRTPSYSGDSSSASLQAENTSPTKIHSSIADQVAQNQIELEATELDSEKMPPSPSLRIQKTRSLTVKDETVPPLSDNVHPSFMMRPLSPIDLDNEDLESMPAPPQEDLPEDISLEELDDDYMDIPSLNSRSSVDEQLTARITSILSNMPTRIKLASGPGLDATEVKHRATSLQPTPARPLRSATPSLTLAPAYTKSSRPRPQHGSPDIKLYHLHQPGKENPIKLFVRLVGEGGERVMVRVGGGWADLGEYLKEYATHHGRRSVSDGKFEITQVAQSSNSIATLGTINSGRTTPTIGSLRSGRSTPTSRPSSPLPRPGSSLNNRKVRRVSGVTGSPYTPEIMSRQYDGTPGSMASRPGSVRSSSRMSWTEEDVPLGLAGPKSKKVEMSPKKQAWVEGMLSQARQASASAEKKRPASAEKKRDVLAVGSTEKKKGDRGELAEIGKVGSTRRVFVKTKMEE